MESIYEDIYQYEFEALFNKIKPIIGRNAIQMPENDDERELDEMIGESNLLFDISGTDFSWFKSIDSKYRYWVEVYILKIVEKMLSRKKLWYEEKYYPKNFEKHSLVFCPNGATIECYFLFDITSNEAYRTEYDKIASELKSKNNDVDEINIYIFRDRISMNTLAWLLTGKSDHNENGYIDVYPLQEFFIIVFGEDEYSFFEKYANEFHSKCNNILSYKTIIMPNNKTLISFKKKKTDMLKSIDYKSIADNGKSGQLSDSEFETVRDNYIDRYMYIAMISNNDFADSFISAEWAYDVYSNAMGDLELTGIIAGYLKSIEQLLYKITQFHRDQGIRIQTRKEGKQPYTSEIEEDIDSTLNSLNEFITSKEGKLAFSVKIRGCIHTAVSLWTKYQRNGFFHKQNLYSDYNKIEEVRELTLYLYFLILGGIKFSDNERIELGVCDNTESNNHIFSFDNVYPKFEKWLTGIIKYDLPEHIPGIWFTISPPLLTGEKEKWSISSRLMKYFYIDDFENGEFNYIDIIDLNNLRCIPNFSFHSEKKREIDVQLQFLELFDSFREKNRNLLNEKINAIVIGLDKTTQLIHYNGK